MSAQFGKQSLQACNHGEPATLKDICSPPNSRIARAQEAQFETDLLNLVPFLQSFARSLSRNRELAEDLAQETLLSAWRARGSYKPGTNLKAWLCIILRNGFYSHIRRAWRQMPWDQEEAERISDTNPEQAGVIDLSDTLRALQHIPATQREAVALIGAGGLSYSEAEQVLHCGEGTLKSRVARGRRALVSVLESKRTLARRPRSTRAGAAEQLMAEIARLEARANEASSGAE